MNLVTLSIIVFVAICLIDVVHYIAMFFFLRGINRYEYVRPTTPFTPKTAVLLPLRGVDPFLKQCLRKLFQQEYPDYTVFLIFDHYSDPAYSVAR
ncbi:MAG: hypothetical protein ACRC2T_01540, partial [Thermoguttaceae bacterium]